MDKVYTNFLRLIFFAGNYLVIKKTKSVYLNEPSQVLLSSQVNGGNNRTAGKRCLKLSTESPKKPRLDNEGLIANIAERQ